MLQLLTWTTPNGIKPIIMLEELGQPFELRWIDIGHGAQHEPSYLRINPNGKIPSLVDGAVSVFESGAILIYLAEKFDRFLPSESAARAATLGWLFFQVGSIGPMFGQLGHFLMAEQQVPYALERYRKEVERLYGVLNERLAQAEYLAGHYSIADIASYGWVARHEALGVSLQRYPHVSTWLERLAARPAVQRALARKP